MARMFAFDRRPADETSCARERHATTPDSATLSGHALGGRGAPIRTALEGDAMTFLRTILSSMALVALAILCAPSQANELAGHKTVSLVTPAGDKLVIGYVDLTRKDAGYEFSLSFKKDAFVQIYMQETNFLCLVTPSKEVCHFPFPPGDYTPNDSSGFVTETDMRALEHGLLFAEKRPAPAEIDINPFNGLYYRLKAVADRIEGTPFGVDLKRAIVEGGAGNYPIRPRDLDPLDPPSQRFPRLVIE